MGRVVFIANYFHSQRYKVFQCTDHDGVVLMRLLHCVCVRVGCIKRRGGVRTVHKKDTRASLLHMCGCVAERQVPQFFDLAKTNQQLPTPTNVNQTSNCRHYYPPFYHHYYNTLPTLLIHHLNTHHLHHSITYQIRQPARPSAT